MLTKKSTWEEEVSENFPCAGESEPLGENTASIKRGDQEGRVSGDGLFVFSTVWENPI